MTGLRVIVVEAIIPKKISYEVRQTIFFLPLIVIKIFLVRQNHDASFLFFGRRATTMVQKPGTTAHSVVV
jgi:hypothetical protein